MVQYAIASQVEGPVAYVLAGGASFGSVQVGQLRALADSDLRPDFVVGTSVGSLNGAVVAENPETAPQRLTELWESVTRDEIFGGVLSAAVSVATGRASAIKNEGLRAMIERAVAARDFADLAIPHTAMACDFETGLPVPISEGELVSALLASAAIPMVFPSIVRDGKRLVDGGLVANVPIGQAIDQGARTIVVLDCGFTVLPPQDDSSFAAKLTRTLAIMAAQQVRREMADAQGLTVLYLPGPWPIESRPDDFSKAVDLAAKAEILAREWLSDLTIVGPGRYGLAPSDALTESRPPLSREARALAEESGVIPVDEEKVREVVATVEAQAEAASAAAEVAAKEARLVDLDAGDQVRGLAAAAGQAAKQASEAAAAAKDAASAITGGMVEKVAGRKDGNDGEDAGDEKDGEDAGDDKDQ